MSMTRRFCAQCRSETLHKRLLCVHCSQDVEVKKLSVPRTRRPYSVEFRGELLSLKQIAERTGLAYETITLRFRNGLRGERLIARVPPRMARPKHRRAA
jgi:hypothetical protein